MIVNGTMHGHEFLNHKNHASGGALVNISARTNPASIGARKLNATRPVYSAINKSLGKG